jgi:GNAT superfamily N-acetyltransferase
VAPVVIEPLTRARVGEAAATLARAFYDSPLFEFVFPAGTARLKVTAAMFTGILVDVLPFGTAHVAVDRDGIVGAAAWYPPEGYPATPRRQAMKYVRLPVLLRHAPRRMGVAMRYLQASERVHPKAVHWYLNLLGVDPRHQGEGIGARLVDHRLHQLDREGLPAYLETDRESNLAWYARRRFEPRETLHPEPGGPPVWTMWRDPRDP